MYMLLIVLVNFLMTPYSGKFAQLWKSNTLFELTAQCGTITVESLLTVSFLSTMIQPQNWITKPWFSGPALQPGALLLSESILNHPNSLT